MLGITLMAKLIQPKKIILIFKVCDDDEDDVLSAQELKEMLTRVERIFQQENAME